MESGEDVEFGSHRDYEDVKELKEVLNVIAQFLSDIRKPISELLKELMEAFRGDSFGKDVADFYKNLVDGGVPREMAEKLTEKYVDKRLALMPSLSGLIRELSRRKLTPEGEAAFEEEEPSRGKAGED